MSAQIRKTTTWPLSPSRSKSGGRKEGDAEFPRPVWSAVLEPCVGDTGCRERRLNQPGARGAGPGEPLGEATDGSELRVTLRVSTPAVSPG